MADDPGKSTADGPRPDTAETTHAPGDGASSGGMGPAPQGIPVPVPWYRRPLFWGIVLSLLILATNLIAKAIFTWLANKSSRKGSSNAKKRKEMKAS